MSEGYTELRRARLDDRDSVARETNNAMKKSLQVLALMAVGLALFPPQAAASCRPATS
jgi:hypothetical protein